MFTSGYYDVEKEFLDDKNVTSQTPEVTNDEPTSGDSRKSGSLQRNLMGQGFSLRLISNFMSPYYRRSKENGDNSSSMLTQKSLDNVQSTIERFKDNDPGKGMKDLKQNSDMKLIDVRRIKNSIIYHGDHDEEDLSSGSFLAGVTVTFGDKRRGGLQRKLGSQLSLVSIMSMAPRDMNMPYTSSQHQIWDSINTSVSNIEDYEIEFGGDSKGFANEPHQALEFPVLYFLLKRFPTLKKSIGSFYKRRWSILNILQKRISIREKLFHKRIVITWGELLFIMPFIALFVSAIFTSFIYPDVSLSGRLSRLPLFIAILTSNHNSLFTLFMGLPFERSLVYHKLSGRIAFLNGLFHTYTAFFCPQNKLVSHTTITTVNSTSNIFEKSNQVTKQAYSFEPPPYSWHGSDRNFAKFSFENQINSSGSIILLLMFSIIITTMPQLRKKCFEAFFYLHIIFTLIMVACAFYHSGILVPIFVGILYGGDIFIRKVIMAGVRYPTRASITHLTNDVVEISFTKTNGFDYNPGQYVYLAIPDISFFQWHPFSLSSSPFQTRVTIHVRNAGNWTNRLFDLADKKKEVAIWLEGPYGSVTVDLLSDRYQMVMLMSGGIGVTPMQSICNQLMNEFESGKRSMHKLWFVWTARDPDIMDRMDVSRRPRINSISASKTLKQNVKIGHTIDRPLEGKISLDDATKTITPSPEIYEDHSSEESYKNESMCRPELERQKSSFQNTTIPVMEEFDDAILKLDYFLTAKEKKYHENLPHQHRGRPDIPEILSNIRKEAIKCRQKRVAFCICAPTRLVNICRKACAKYSDEQVRFDFHSEVFD